MRGLRSLADIYALLGISFFLLRFLHQQPIIISGSATDASTTAVLMSLINSAVQIFIIAFAAKRHSLFEQPLALVLLASIASIGQVLMYINNEGGVLAGTNLLIGGFMASLGAAMLPLLWHEIACRSQAAGHMRYVVALATIISALLFLIAFSFPEPISTILDSVSPLASLVFLLLARKENGDAFATKAVDDPLPEESNGTPSAIARYSPYMPLFIACFICTIPQGLVRSALFPPNRHRPLFDANGNCVCHSRYNSRACCVLSHRVPRSDSHFKYRHIPNHTRRRNGRPLLSVAEPRTCLGGNCEQLFIVLGILLFHPA